jgi:archaellum biogenesis ATPase FlaH
VIKFQSIPNALRERPQWVLWTTIQRDKPTKVPYQPNGDFAKANDAATWSAYDVVCAAYEQGGYDGIGFEFALDDPFCGIDLDGCRDPETGIVAEWAKKIILELDTYAEVSPSETGIKLFAIGKLPLSGGRKKELAHPKVCDKNPAIEIYDHARYFAVTGWRLAGQPDPQNRTEVINAICKRYWPAPKPPEDFSDSPAVMDRARKYLSKIPPSVSGCGGHNSAFHAACVLTHGFMLDREQALTVIGEWNQLCQPPWSDRELEHKIDSALKTPGQRGFLRNAPPATWDAIAVPDYQSQKPSVRSTTLVDACTRYIDSLRDGGSNLIELGLADLDYAIGGGVAKGEMVIIAGRPSHGKSLVALQVVHTWTRRGMPTLVISEEMSAMAIGKRALQFLSDIPQESWDKRLEELEESLKWYSESHDKCFIIEAARTVERVEQLVEQYVTEHQVEGVVIDYAQLLSSPGKSRYEQITNMSVSLRALANKHNIVLLALCQLNRAVESRTHFIPQASDLKDSGQLEQDADVVIACVWPHRVNSSEDPKKYQFFPMKNRNRPIICDYGMVECRLLPSRQTVEDRKPEYVEWDPEPGGYDQYAQKD